MRKFFALCLALLLVLPLAACGETKAPAPTATTAPPIVEIEEEVPAAGSGIPEEIPQISGNYLMATGGTSGTYYAYGGVICHALNQATGVHISANSTGASVENMHLLRDNKAQFAIVQTDIYAYAAEGSHVFEGEEAIGNVKVIASLYPEFVQVVTTDTELRSVADLRGKAVSVGEEGSGTELNARQFLEAYGMSFDDIDARFLSFTQSGDALQEGSLDAAFMVAGLPNSAIEQLAKALPVKLLSLDAEHAALLEEKYPFYSDMTIEREIYGLPEDTSTLAMHALLVCSADISEDDVYAITRALFEKQPDIAKNHDKGAELSLETSMIGVIPGSVHPGAARYYAEMDIQIP